MNGFIWTILISAAAALISFLTLVDKHYGKGARIESRLAIVEKATVTISPEIEKRLTALETMTKPFWRILEDHMVDLLKQPTHLKMDALLEEYKESREEMPVEKLIDLKCELLSALDESKRIPTRKNDGLTFGYIIMLGILESRISQKMIKREEPEEQKKCISRTTT